MKNIKIIIFLLFLFVFQKGIASSNFNSDWLASFSINVNIGGQDKLVNFTASFFGVSGYGKTNIEGGFNVNYQLYIHKFGVYEKGNALALEAFGMMGWGHNTNMLGSSIGINNRAALYNPLGKGGFSGIGAAINQNFISGSLSKFGNRQGSFLFRFSNDKSTLNINSANDFKAGLSRGGGTDKGHTGSLYVKASHINNLKLETVEFAVELFTPEPDYSRAPRNPLNSADGKNNVSYGTKPHEKLFHANWILKYTHQQNLYMGSTAIGIDNPKAGAYIQNTLHDNFALYPRFGWPVNQKGKLYWNTNFGTTFFGNDNFTNNDF